MIEDTKLKNSITEMLSFYNLSSFHGNGKERVMFSFREHKLKRFEFQVQNFGVAKSGLDISGRNQT